MNRILAILLGASVALAADHADGPALTDDPAADILDVYAFVSPTDPSRFVLALTVHAFATETARFSPRVDYIFTVEQNVPFGEVYDFRCRFDTQAFECVGPGELSASGPLGAAAGDDSFRAWAGLADNPFFFDRDAFSRSVARLRAEPADGPGLCGVEGGANGGDFYAGSNVLALVLELPSTVVNDAGDRPKLLIWARTVRR